MRTLRIILLLLPLFYFSCTKDNPCTITQVEESPILPKQTKLITTENIQNGVHQDTPEVIDQYTYDGNKITSVLTTSTTEDDILEKVTYSGDLITEKINYQNEKIIKKESYKYNNSNQLIEYIIDDKINTELSLKEVYTHNSDGSIAVVLYHGIDFSKQFATSKITFTTNGEVDKIELKDTENDLYIYSYTYDDKKHIFGNVTGRASISYTNYEVDGINHNVLSETTTYKGQVLQKYTYQYSYNEDNYPTTVVATGNSEIGKSNVIAAGQVTY